MPAWAIEGPRHAGITVSDLDRSLSFYEGVDPPLGCHDAADDVVHVGG